MSRTTTFVQADFGLGQVTKAAARRLDNAMMRRACRVASNFQPNVTGAAEARSGRAALFLSGARVDEVTMPGNLRFKLEFGAGFLKIRNVSLAVVATFTGLPWDAAGLPIIRWALFTTQLIVTYAGMRQKVVSYDTVAGTWSIADFTFSDGIDGYTRQPYYRFPSTLGISLQPSARSGTINVVFSANVLTAQHVGCSFRYGNEELIIATVTDGQHGTATVVKKLPPSGQLSLIVGTGDTTPVTDGFYIGDIIEGRTSGCRAQITSVASNVIKFVILKNFSGFVHLQSSPYQTEDIISPRSKAQFTTEAYDLAPEPTTVWDEAFMSPARGWPASCSVDRRRLTFCQFPSETTAILWSEIGTYNGFNIGGLATDAILELVPGQAGVIDVIGGLDQFVLCNSAIFWIPISETNPLKPGSVEFRPLGPEGAANIAPANTTEGVVYIGAAQTRVMAIAMTGQISRIYTSRDLTLYHADLINNPRCIAVTSGDGTRPERYVFVVNGDGTMAVGRYDPAEQVIGWFPWSGSGLVKWASARLAVPLFVTSYGGVVVAEGQSQGPLLDGEVPATSPPAQLAPGMGQGPFWMYPSQTLTLRRGGRPVGDRAVDASGNVIWIPADENRTLDDLTAGFDWTGRLGIYIPQVPEGETRHQHMRKRKIARASVTVQDSTGFVCGGRRIAMYDVRDDRTLDPPQRDETYTFRPAGRAFDPQFDVVKDTIGSLRVLEIAGEVTV